MNPPANIIDAAIRAALWSPCEKSKRGAVVFYMYSTGDRGMKIATGFNGPPGAIACTGTDACRAVCGRACVHAESRAIRAACERAKPQDGSPALEGLEILHAKIVAGELVAGGPPSCWQCSREILDAGLGSVWLYELDVEAPASAAIHGKGVWRRYSAAEFHAVTWENVRKAEGSR